MAISNKKLPSFDEVGISQDMFKRFSLDNERSLEEQIASLVDTQKKAFEDLKAKWSSKPRKTDYSDAMILRFLRASPGETKFNLKTAYQVMKKYEKWSLEIDLPNLTIQKIQKQLETKTLVIPGSKSKKNHHILYMRPALYFPGKNDLDELMRCLVYLLERMTERESTATEGLAFMANMKDWGYSNFSITYAKNFFDTMQGRFPCRVRLFLIVNPPSWFGTIWSLIRPMMSAQFAEKVFLPKGKELFDYIDPENVPKDLGGTLDLNESLKAFIKYRSTLENIQQKEKVETSSDSKMSSLD